MEKKLLTRVASEWMDADNWNYETIILYWGFQAMSNAYLKWNKITERWKNRCVRVSSLWYWNCSILFCTSHTIMDRSHTSNTMVFILLFSLSCPSFTSFLSLFWPLSLAIFFFHSAYLSAYPFLKLGFSVSFPFLFLFAKPAIWFTVT